MIIEVPSFWVVNLNSSRFGIASSFRYGISTPASWKLYRRRLSSEKIIHGAIRRFEVGAGTVLAVPKNSWVKSSSFGQFCKLGRRQVPGCTVCNFTISVRSAPRLSYKPPPAVHLCRCHYDPASFQLVYTEYRRQFSTRFLAFERNAIYLHDVLLTSPLQLPQVAIAGSVSLPNRAPLAEAQNESFQ